MILDLNNLTPDQLKKIEEIGFQIETPFNDMIERLSLQYSKDKTWWFTIISSRDVLQSDLFFNCCKLSLVKYYVENDVSVEKIIVDNPAMQEVLSRYAARQGLPITIECKTTTAVIRWLKRKRMVWHRCVMVFMLFLCSRLFKRQIDTDKGKMNIVSIFAGDSNIIKDQFVDHYYRGLLQDQSCMHEDFLYMPNIHFSLKKYMKHYQCLVRANVIIAEQYLRASDFLIKLVQFIDRNRKRDYTKTKIKFAGMDISPVMQYESRANAFSPNSIGAYLKYLSSARLKENGIQINLAIDWYEAQMLNRGLIMGMRENYPDMLIIGYCAYTYSSHVIHWKPTAYEKAAGIIPDIFGVIGEANFVDARKFCQSIVCKLVPGYRYLSGKSSKALPKILQQKKVVVGLSWQDQVNNHIVNLVKKINESSQISEHYQFIFKFHPDTNEKIIKEYSKNLPSNCMIKNDLISQIMDSCAIFIGTASSTCIEALTRGLYVCIISNPQGLTINSIPESVDKDLYQIIYTAEELKKALTDYDLLDEVIKQQMSERASAYKDRYFEPFDGKDKLLPFLAIQKEWLHEKSAI